VSEQTALSLSLFPQQQSILKLHHQVTSKGISSSVRGGLIVAASRSKVHQQQIHYDVPLQAGKEQQQQKVSVRLFSPLVLITRAFSTNSIRMASTTNGSQARQNFHEECEAKINRQINMELYASYVYMSMAHHFDRDDVSFPGMYKFFKKSSDEEREHAEKFMKYQNERGGRIVLQAIAKPTKDDWDSPLDAFSAALELEKTVNMTLLDLHGIAGQHNDPQLCDFLETHFLEEQVKSIKELSDYVTQLKRCGKGLGEYLFDKELGETS